LFGFVGSGKTREEKFVYPVPLLVSVGSEEDIFGFHIVYKAHISTSRYAAEVDFKRNGTTRNGFMQKNGAWNQSEKLPSSSIHNLLRYLVVISSSP
jgi:hypothetical protein